MSSQTREGSLSRILPGTGQGTRCTAKRRQGFSEIAASVTQM
jgi:hypothetical protein